MLAVLHHRRDMHPRAVRVHEGNVVANHSHSSFPDLLEDEAAKLLFVHKLWDVEQAQPRRIAVGRKWSFDSTCALSG